MDVDGQMRSLDARVSETMDVGGRWRTAYLQTLNQLVLGSSPRREEQAE